MQDTKGKALENKKGLKKVHESKQRCRHCGEVTSKETSYSSGHSEYDHERGPMGCAIKG